MGDGEERLSYQPALDGQYTIFARVAEGFIFRMAFGIQIELRRIEIALGEAGATMADVVRTRMFVTDISRWQELGAVHAEVFGDIRPVTSMLEVSALPNTGLTPAQQQTATHDRTVIATDCSALGVRISG